MDESICWCGEDADSECVECGEQCCRVHDCSCPIEFDSEADRQEFEQMCTQDCAPEVSALESMLLLSESEGK